MVSLAKRPDILKSIREENYYICTSAVWSDSFPDFISWSRSNCISFMEFLFPIFYEFLLNLKTICRLSAQF